MNSNFFLVPLFFYFFPLFLFFSVFLSLLFFNRFKGFRSRVWGKEGEYYLKKIENKSSDIKLM